jgi:hypothetical protein
MKNLLSLCVVALLGLVPGFAQVDHKVEVSAYAGVPLNHTLRDAFCCSTAASFISHATDDASYITGLSAGVVLADRVHITFGAMYMPVSFREIGTVDIPPVRRVTSTTHGTSWEFPLLGDYRWLKGAVRPFSGGGFVIANRISGNPGTSQSPAPVLSGGVEWVRYRFVIRPEFRYTHYPQNDSSNVAVGRPSTQIQFLVGVTYRM